jgi:hypothetical protein
MLPAEQFAYPVRRSETDSVRSICQEPCIGGLQNVDIESSRDVRTTYSFARGGALISLTAALPRNGANRICARPFWRISARKIFYRRFRPGDLLLEPQF